MRAPLRSAAFAFALIFYLVSLVSCYELIGYQVEDEDNSDIIDVVDVNAVCPTDRVLRSQTTCHIAGADIPCIKLHCCDNYIYIAGRCIPRAVDPCGLKLCEQACEVKNGRLWCTCYNGYRFSVENWKHKKQPYCEDIDECSSGNHGCEQKCVNDPGSYHCLCEPPLLLANDGKRCVPLAISPSAPLVASIQEPLPLTRASSRCYAPCDTVTWLSRKLKQLNDQLRATQTVLKKLVDSPMLKSDGSERFAEGNYAYRILDATAPLEGGYCRCERGPRGPPGAAGMEGPKGDAGARGPRGARGPPGSLDLMLLLLADIRHDIRNLEARVYPKGEQPERFNLQKTWKRQRKLDKEREENDTKLNLEAYTAPAVEEYDTNNQINHKGEFANRRHGAEATTDWSLVKGHTDPDELPTEVAKYMDEKYKQFLLIANASSSGDEEEENDYDYNFY